MSNHRRPASILHRLRVATGSTTITQSYLNLKITLMRLLASHFSHTALFLGVRSTYYTNGTGYAVSILAETSRFICFSGARSCNSCINLICINTGCLGLAWAADSRLQRLQLETRAWRYPGNSRIQECMKGAWGGHTFSTVQSGFYNKETRG